MTEDTKNQTDVTPEGIVEIREEDLDQASGGAGYLKMPTDQLKFNKLDTSLKFGGGGVRPGSYDLSQSKKI